MTEPKWINMDLASALHEIVVERFGGKDGVLDRGLVEGVLVAS